MPENPRFHRARQGCVKDLVHEPGRTESPGYGNESHIECKLREIIIWGDKFNHCCESEKIFHSEAQHHSGEFVRTHYSIDGFAPVSTQIRDVAPQWVPDNCSTELL